MEKLWAFENWPSPQDTALPKPLGYPQFLLGNLPVYPYNMPCDLLRKQEVPGDVATAMGTAVMLRHRTCTRYSHDPQLCPAALSQVFLVSPKSARDEKRTAEDQCSCLMCTNDLPCAHNIAMDTLTKKY